MNMGYVSSWYLPVDTTSIEVADDGTWEQCLEPEAKCLRYAKWKPL